MMDMLRFTLDAEVSLVKTVDVCVLSMFSWDADGFLHLVALCAFAQNCSLFFARASCKRVACLSAPTHKVSK